MKKLISLLLLISMMICFGSCSDSGDTTSTSGTKNSGTTETTEDGLTKAVPVAESEIVMVEMKIKDFGTIKLELYKDTAPITVANFVKLVSEGFYDGLTFHRIYSGFMIQGGDPNGNGTGGSSETIKGEFASNGIENPISHKRGVISMARSTAKNSASSQFFIMHADSDFLDGNYAAFGKVVEGMEVVDKIAAVECDYSYTDQNYTTPKNPPVIEYAKVIED